MRRALARLLTLVLTLTVTALAALFALSSVAGPRAHARAALPLYFNFAPRNAHDLAQAAVERLGRSDDAAAATDLARLGGAALPYVLPGLDALRSPQRERIAVALAPVARRMGVGTEEELRQPEAAVAFWSRFWQDRGFDFRQQVARRLVGRLHQKSSALRREDLAYLDTYALPELMAALGAIRTEADVQRAAHLTAAISRVLGDGRAIGPGSSVAHAREIVREWQNYWTEQGADFVTLDGPQRLVALLSQSQLGHWLSSVMAAIRNPQSAANDAAIGIPGNLALASVLRFVASWLLALSAAVAWLRFELFASPRARSMSRFVAAAATVPVPWFVSLLGVPAPLGVRQLLAVCLTGLCTAAQLSRHALAVQGRASSQPLRVMIGDTLAAAAACQSLLLTSLFCLELVLDLPGAAGASLAALGSGQIGPSMALALGGAVAARILVLLSQRAPRSLDAIQRVPSLVVVEESRRLLTVGVATMLVLAVLGAAFSSSTQTATPSWPDVAAGARAFLIYGTLSALIAALAGLALGALAANGPALVDAFLTLAVELAGCMPALFWVAAMSVWWGDGLLCAVGVGALRAVEVAWLLRSELGRRALRDAELLPRSLGYLPLRAYLNDRLRPALFPALTAVALTPAWALTIAVAGRVCSLHASAGGVGWTRLLAETSMAGVAPSLAAAILLVLPCWVLLSMLTRVPRRLGAIRASRPPPDGAAA